MLLSGLLAFMLGSITAAAELLSKYRDEPWKALITRGAIVYLFINGLISMFAYVVVIYFKIIVDSLQASLVSGTGAMAILRSKLFVYASGSGKEYSIGPDIVINVFMKAISGQIDRERAFKRQKLIICHMADLEDGDFDSLVKFFDTVIPSFQGIDKDDIANHNDMVKNLIKDNELPNKLKIFKFGYLFVTLVGEDNFVFSMKNFKDYYAHHLKSTP